MNKKIIKILKKVIPPIIFDIINLCKKKYGFFGDYASWEEALKMTSSYESQDILNKVRDSLAKVRDGQAVYERDSVLFDKIEISFPLLCGLMMAALDNKGELIIVDYGGSLGSTYFQNKNILGYVVKSLKWNIIEQRNFIECGKKEFETEELKFYYSLEECLRENSPNVLILSSFLQYIDKPRDFIRKTLEFNFKYIIIDRTMFAETKENRDIVTVQVVPPEIYTASYPAWFFNKEKLVSFFSDRYTLINEFDCMDQHQIPGFTASGNGFVFRLK